VNATAARLAEHVQRLADEHGVTIEHQGRGIGYRKQRRITVPPVRGRASYFVALHELGHVVGPNPRRRLDQETAAWQWALDHALDDPTPAVARMIARCLRSYRARAERAAFGTVLPDGFDDFLARVDALT
jgi:hypothetical protein